MVVQVSLSLVLLIAAGLLLKSLDRARNADPGFDARNVLVAGVDLLPNGYDMRARPDRATADDGKISRACPA